MVQQLWDVPGHEDPGVVAVEAEPVSLLLYPGVETPAVPPEADTEQILVLGRVPQQKTALWPLVQQRFRLIPAVKCNVIILTLESLHSLIFASITLYFYYYFYLCDSINKNFRDFSREGHLTLMEEFIFF